MAITYPRTDIMSAVRWSDASAPPQLVSRQEQSRLASGKTIGKDLGPALWMVNLTTDTLSQAQSLAFEAMLNSLDGVIQTFEAGDMRQAAQLPLGSDGSFADIATLNSVNPNNKAMALGNLPPGFVLQVGSYLSFDYAGSRALHQVMETVTTAGTGITPQFEVRPFIRPGFTIASPVTPVKLKSPRGVFVMLPGTVQSKMSGGANCVVTFQAIQALS